MTQQQIYQAWKPSALGAKIDIDKEYGDQCVDVDLSYGEALFPGVSWSTVFPPVANAKQLFASHNPTYFDAIANDHSNANQVPEQGDILVCDATPAPGYSNQFSNPAGHTGVVDSADSSGYTILMQDGSVPTGNAYLQSQAWRYRPVIGWLRPKLAAAPSPTSAPPPTTHGGPAKKLFLPASVYQWRVYNLSGPWTPGHEIAFLRPSAFPPGLTYDILGTLGLGTNMYEIQTQDFGKVAIYAGPDTDAIIN